MSKVLLARFSILALCAAGFAGCAIDSVERPGLTGPSDLAQDVQVTATPDSLVLDGVSSSAIVVTVRGVNGEPIPNAQFRLSIDPNSSLGVITPTTVFTDSNGRAAAQFIPAKASPALAGAPAKRISIIATPVRSNYQTTTPFDLPSADVLLLYPAVPPATAGAPVPSVLYAPTTPKVGNVISFDATTSQAASGSSLVTYVWDFGDGRANDEHGPDASYAYAAAGTYYMTLAITDDSGRTGYTFRAVTVTN